MSQSVKSDIRREFEEAFDNHLKTLDFATSQISHGRTALWAAKWAAEEATIYFPFGGVFLGSEVQEQLRHLAKQLEDGA